MHQLLQWHHLVTSAGYPATSLENLEFNTLLDGAFHAGTYLLTALGLMMLWRAARYPHSPWSSKLLMGTVLMGFGTFNLVEGLINHHLLELHHVNERAPRDQWIFWDAGFLMWGTAMLIGGWTVHKWPGNPSVGFEPLRPNPELGTGNELSSTPGTPHE
jgi:uncharacterized membrane protein